MPIIESDRNKMSHGVTQLTYVGDDGAEALVPVSVAPGHTIIGVAGLAAVFFGRGILQLAGAAAIGYVFGSRQR